MAKGAEKFKKVALAIGIAIVLSTFAGFFSYELGKSLSKPDGNIENCNVWDACNNVKGTYDNCMNICRSKGLPESNCVIECQTEKSVYDGCAKQCQDKSDAYYKSIEDTNDRKMQIFAISTLIIGAVAVVIGILLMGVGAVSAGLIFGGIICILEAIIGYWSRMEGWMRVVALGVLLALLIFVGFKKLKD